MYSSWCCLSHASPKRLAKDSTQSGLFVVIRVKWWCDDTVCSTFRSLTLIDYLLMCFRTSGPTAKYVFYTVRAPEITQSIEGIVDTFVLSAGRYDCVGVSMAKTRLRASSRCTVLWA